MFLIEILKDTYVRIYRVVRWFRPSSRRLSRKRISPARSSLSRWVFRLAREISASAANWSDGSTRNPACVGREVPEDELGHRAPTRACWIAQLVARWLLDSFVTVSTSRSPPSARSADVHRRRILSPDLGPVGLAPQVEFALWASAVGPTPEAGLWGDFGQHLAKLTA